MATEILVDVVLPGGVVLDASIFDERSYVELDDRWLAEAEIRLRERRAKELAADALVLTSN
jgi:hypothetical protein